MNSPTPAITETPVRLIGPGPIVDTQGVELPVNPDIFIPIGISTPVTFLAVFAHPELQPNISEIFSTNEKSLREGKITLSNGWIVLKPSQELKLNLEPNSDKFTPAEGLFYIRKNGEFWFSPTPGLKPPVDSRLIGRVEFPDVLIRELPNYKDGLKVDSITFGLVN